MRRPAFGHLLGYTALTVILTAGAAQSLAGSNTVFTDDIVDGTIKHVDIKPNSIGGSRFLDNSVTGSKIANGSVTGADVLGTSLTYEAEGDSIDLDPGESSDLEAFCASENDEALSGQWVAEKLGTDDRADELSVSFSASFTDGWDFHIKNTSDAAVGVTVWVTCIQR